MALRPPPQAPPLAATDSARLAAASARVWEAVAVAVAAVEAVAAEVVAGTTSAWSCKVWLSPGPW